MKGKGKSDFYNVIALNGGNPDCDPSTNSFQNNKYDYQTEDKSFYIEQAYTVDTRNSLLNIFAKDVWQYPFTASLALLHNPNAYKDSIPINGIVYKGVYMYRYVSTGDGNYVKDSLRYVFYNVDEGLLRLKLGNQILDRQL